MTDGWWRGYVPYVRQTAAPFEFSPVFSQLATWSRYCRIRRWDTIRQRLIGILLSICRRLFSFKVWQLLSPFWLFAWTKPMRSSQLVPTPNRHWTCTCSRPRQPLPWFKTMVPAPTPTATCSTTSPSSRVRRTFLISWHATIGSVSSLSGPIGARSASNSLPSGARWPMRTVTSTTQTRENWFYPAPSALPRLNSPSTRTCAVVWAPVDCRTCYFIKVPLGWQGRSHSISAGRRPSVWSSIVRSICWLDRRRGSLRRGLNLLLRRSKCCEKRRRGSKADNNNRSVIQA